MPARETLSRMEELGRRRTLSLKQWHNLQNLLSIYLLTQDGISTLKEVPSNGLFVYLGLHAVSDALDSRTLASETVDVGECEPTCENPISG